MKNENFRVPEREELPQEEKYDEKTRGPELLKVPEERERRMKRFANQKVRRWQNHFRKQETDRGQQTISRGKYFF